MLQSQCQCAVKRVSGKKGKLQCHNCHYKKLLWHRQTGLECFAPTLHTAGVTIALFACMLRPMTDSQIQPCCTVEVCRDCEGPAWTPPCMIPLQYSSRVDRCTWNEAFSPGSRFGLSGQAVVSSSAKFILPIPLHSTRLYFSASCLMAVVMVI